MKKVAAIILSLFFILPCRSQSKIAGAYDPFYHHFFATDTSIKTKLFHDGRSAFIQHNRVGFIDTAGNIILAAKYAAYAPYSNGVALLKNSAGQFGLVDAAGNEMVPFDKIWFIKTSTQGFLFGDKNSVNLVDKFGQTIIPSGRYEQVYRPRVFREFYEFGTRRAPLLIVTHQDEFLITNYIGVKKDDKWGYVDSSGREIIPPAFDAINNFQFGMALIKNGDRQMIIDITGKVIMINTYDTLIPVAPNGLVIKIKNRYGLIDRNGTQILSPAYDGVTLLNDQAVLITNDGKSGVADLNGKVIIGPLFANIDPIPGGFVARRFDGTKILYNKDGKLIASDIGFYEGGVVRQNSFKDPREFLYNSSTQSFDTYTALYPVTERYFMYKVGDKLGLTDTTGRSKVSPIYDRIERLTVQDVNGIRAHSFIRVQQGVKYGLLDADLHTVFPVEYELISDYSGDLGIVKKEGKYGVFDLKGTLLTPVQYDYALGGFGYTEYQGKKYFNPLRIVGINNKYGFINNLGQQKTPIKYDRDNSFFDGRLQVAVDGKKGLLDTTGSEIIPCQYDQLWYMEHNKRLITVVKDKKMGAYNTSGKIILPVAFDRIEENYYSTDLMVKNDNKYGVVDTAGNILIPLLYDGIEFSDKGFWLLSLGNKKGFFAPATGHLFEPTYDETIIAGENMLVVKKAEKYGIVNTGNQELYPVRFKKVYVAFNETLLTTEDGKEIRIKNDKFRAVKNIPQLAAGWDEWND